MRPNFFHIVESPISAYVTEHTTLVTIPLTKHNEQMYDRFVVSTSTAASVKKFVQENKTAVSKDIYKQIMTIPDTTKVFVQS